MKPIATTLRKIILLAIQTEPYSSHKKIAADYNVCERTVYDVARNAGIHRKPGRKKHPREWTAAERRNACRLAKAEEAREYIGGKEEFQAITAGIEGGE